MNIVNVGRLSASFNLLFGSFLIYTWLATGFYFNLREPEKSLFGAALLLLTFMYAAVNVRRLEVRGLCVTFVMGLPFFIVLILSIVFMSSTDLGVEKFVSFGVPVVFSMLIASVVLKAHGLGGLLEGFVKVCFIVLLLTIFYKLVFGFFDRTVRYFINGPIVFGWLMGAAALLAATSPERKINVLLFPIFSLATFWSFSKGPVLALILCLFIYGVIVSRSPVKALVLVLVVGLFLWILKGVDVPAVERMFLVFEKGGDALEVGSISARYEMAIASVNVFSEHPFVGVGLGNWAKYVQWGGATYPHNITFEILSEVGLLGFISILFWLVPACFISDRRCLIVFFFLLLSAQFSGDIGYFRMAAFFVAISYLNLGGKSGLYD